MLETTVRSERATPYRSWVVACAMAETVGMTAAAGAAVLADGMAAAAALAVVVAGGLVEGVALGVAQGAVLGRIAPGLSRARYLAVTVLVAGLGWAAASAPSAVGGGEAEQPPMLLVVLGAAALGLVLGPVLGAAQATALRGVVRHPRRWTVANAAAWPVVMAVIFVGATAPDASWPTWTVLATGTATGVVAGGVLGGLTAPFLPSLSGPSVSSRWMLRRLASRHPAGLQGSLVGLAVRGRTSGRTFRFPVQYALAPGGLVLVPGRPERKTWWRNLDRVATSVEVLREGVWAPATARLVEPGDVDYAGALAAYVERWPDASVTEGQPLVLLRVGADRADR
ncbi:hypothetical protein [Nocardioides mangrovi]|uniref:DUF385 domain-containing protein n=1 Tax=Nocardioides mangrovi TaxID=2874580 RepID=A0ABS7U9E1_9ACTN|nr:hypothetical protein [Nocardioides mangrovi]MBZ5737474.1 hypothetical protein [Nocardioides mangrovi]